MSKNDPDPLNLGRKRNFATGIAIPRPEDGHERRPLNRAERRVAARRARAKRPSRMRPET
jgi:hypothetical protein